ncbi:MAG: AMP-binding protein [Chloroflexota bacterium]
MRQQHTLPHPFNQWPTLVNMLRWRAKHQPDQRACTFLVNGDTEADHLTYAQLDHKAQCIGAQLQQMQAQGERILLLHPPSLHFIAAFFGCIYAGAIAVPTVHSFRLTRPNPRLVAITQDAQASIALTSTSLLTKIEKQATPSSHLPDVTWLASDTVDDSLSQHWQHPEVNGQNLAALQYTSGSTGNPRGVMLSHQNLLHNLYLIHRRLALTEADVCVTWLPPYHDMGLIGGYLEPLYSGFPVVLMSPLSFGQQPYRWLKAISDYRGTVTAAPNFAYEQCTQRVTPEQRANLDLRQWRLALTGAEPIRPQTLQRFSSTFADCGFQHNGFYPCYGLAESTLMVTGGNADVAPIIQTVQKTALQAQKWVSRSASMPDSQALVGCGKIAKDQVLFIVHPESKKPCEPGQIGEIWVSSPSVAQGYWQRASETKRVFQAVLDLDDDPSLKNRPFLRTGDLGYVHQGELFVTGRLKEIIIVRGLNYYPQDIEHAVENCHPALSHHGGAAFSAEVAGQERLVIVFEVQRQHRNVDVEDVAHIVRQVISEGFELETYGVVLIKPGQMPRTTSGKIQRLLCQDRFLANTLPEIGRSLRSQKMHLPEQALDTNQTLSQQPREALELAVRQQLAEMLECSITQINLQQSIHSLGLGSLQAAALKYQLEDEFGIEVPPELLLADQNLTQLITKILER